MTSFDRTQIVGLLKPIWPELETMFSSEVQAFLNEKTGCNVTGDMPNSGAFDLWRQAIAKQTEHKHVWPYTHEYVDMVQRREREMKVAEEKRHKEAEEKHGDGIPKTA